MSLDSDARRARPPLLGFAAYSGAGKTTLAIAVIARLRERGVRVGVIKHAHHDFDTDVPGKDSYELRKAGAVQTLVSSRRRWALVTELRGAPEPGLEQLVGRLALDELDLVLVEGFKHERFPKIEIRRGESEWPVLHTSDPSVIALATDAAPAPDAPVPVLDLNDPEAVAEFVVRHVVDRGLHAGEETVP